MKHDKEYLDKYDLYSKPVWFDVLHQGDRP